MQLRIRPEGNLGHHSILVIHPAPVALIVSGPSGSTAPVTESSIVWFLSSLHSLLLWIRFCWLHAEERQGTFATITDSYRARSEREGSHCINHCVIAFLHMRTLTVLLVDRDDALFPF